MGSACPLHYVKLPAREVYDPGLPDALFRTLAQIRGLAYPSGGQRTPPLTLDDLAAIRGAGRTTIFNHLAELRARGIIRTEPAIRNAFTIHLLPGEPGRAARAAREAIPAGDRDDRSATAITGHPAAASPPQWGPAAAMPVVERADAGQAERQSFPPPDREGMQAAGVHAATYRPDGSSPGPGPPNERRNFKNGTRRSESRTGYSKNGRRCSEDWTRPCHVVVKDHDSEQEESKQQHERAHCKNEREFDAALRDLAGLLAAHGMRPGDARRRARALLEECGVDVCARQRQVFERRCELARASPRGLRNPVGLLLASIREDWPLPAAQAERKAARWYTDEEFELFFEH